ncbi:MAG: hypothetical protein HGJ94_03220 [Desulfosarcina sp.]|nr:hypothetical protein [Desulfosarcina sp.]MBC2743764.1 hypothetical protein [Desulfosarcina sp.]MBC2766673.1 hypothetical protein [Desulfosarcina sp.]
MGHVARLMEASGIPTVVVAVAAFEQPLKKMVLPRVLLTPYLLGRPLGLVGDAQGQRAVLRAALDLLESAARPAMVHYRRP